MTGERISGLALVASAQIDPSVQKTMQQDLPQIVRAGTSRITDELQYLSDKTRTSLTQTFTNLDQHFGSVLDKLAQRLAKGVFSVNTETTLRGIKQIGESIDNLGLAFTAGKLLDLGEQLRIPQAISQLQTLKQEFREFSTDQSRYQKWLSVFASSPEKQGLSSPLSGMTRYFAETHGEFNQAAMAGQERDYEASLLDYAFRQEAKRRAGLAGSRLDQHENPQPIGLTPAALAAYNEEARQRAIATSQRLVPTSTQTATMSPAALAAMEAEARQRTLDAARRLDQYGRHVPMSPAAIADRMNPLIPDERTQQRRALAVEMAYDNYTRRADPNSRFNRGDQHRLRFATQNFAFGIDDAIQSYHYGGIGASIRAASNNATAIAGLGISNPMAAAGAVVAISALSAVVARLAPLLDNSRTFVEDEKSSRTNYYRTSSALEQSLYKGEGRSLFDSTNNAILEDMSASDQLRADNLRIRKQFSIKAREELNTIKTRQQGFLGNITAPFSSLFDIVVGNSALPDLAERDKDLAANNQQRLEIQRRLQINRDRQAAILKNIAVENRLSGFNTDQDFAFNSAMQQGRINTIPEYRAALMQRLAAQQALVAGSGLPAPTIQFMNQRLALDMEKQLSSPEAIQRQLTLNRISLAGDRRSFDNQYNSVGPLGGLLTQHSNLLGRISSQIISGELSAEEGSRRIVLAQSKFGRDRGRIVEDEIDRLNPERNPLLRLKRRAERDLQDIYAAKGLTPEERRQQMAALLTGTERARQDLLRPSGQRKFSADGAIDVNSQEDLALKGRMTGTFEWEKKLDTLNKTQEEVVRLMKKLLENLKIEAERLGRK